MTRAGIAVRSAALVLLVVAPALLDNYRVFLLTEILIFGLFAASLDLLVGYSGLPSLGHAGYFGVGAYAAGLLALHVTSNAFAGVAVAVAAAAGVAAATGALAIRSRGVYFLMLTLAFGQLLWVLALTWTSLTGGSNGIYGLPTPTLAGGSSWLRSSNHFYWYTLGVFVVGYVLLKLIVGSPFGRALGGIRENETRMRSLGYNVPIYKLAVFSIAGALAGYAGALACQQLKYFSPDGMSFEVSAVADRRHRHRRPALAHRRRARRRRLLRAARPAFGCALVPLAARPRGDLRPRRLPAAGRHRRRQPEAAREARTMTAILELDAVGRRYGELLAVDGVTLTVAAGARQALIGPNGAGKSTLFGLISGTIKVSRGRIRLHGRDITRLGPHRRTRLGMGRTFQHSSLFDGMTARENVAVALQRTLGRARNAIVPASRMRDVDARSDELLARVGLTDEEGVEAASLSYGHRRQLEIGLALATEPTLLLLDEPTAGMSRDEAARFVELIGSLPAELTIVIVEHDMDIVFGLADRIAVLDAGRLLANGPPDAIRDSAAVQEAYLGPGDRMDELFLE